MSKKYAEEINTPDMFRRAKAGDVEAHQALIMNNMRLVYKIASKYNNLGVDMEELINEGVLALDHSIHKFDVDLGYKFSTYAYWWVKQRIMAYLNKNNRSVQVSPLTILILRKINTAYKKIMQSKGHEPTIEEIADFLNMDVEEVIEYYQHDKKRQDESVLNYNVNEDNFNSSCSFGVTDEGEGELVSQGVTGWYDIVESCVTLTEMEKRILYNVYVLNKNIKSITEENGLTYNKYKKIYVNAMDKVKKAVEGE